VFQDTGLSITLPSAGTYLVISDQYSAIQVTGGTDGFIQTKWYNSTDAAYVANTQTMGAYQYVAYAVNGLVQSTTITTMTVNASKTIKLYAAVFNGSSYSYRVIGGADGTEGHTSMTYVKLSN
jgi:hypothetical protein